MCPDFYDIGTDIGFVRYFHLAFLAHILNSLKLDIISTLRPAWASMKRILFISVLTICLVKDIAVVFPKLIMAILLGVLRLQFNIKVKFFINSWLLCGISTLPKLEIIIVCFDAPVNLLPSLAKKDFKNSGIYFKYGLTSSREVKLIFKSNSSSPAACCCSFIIAI